MIIRDFEGRDWDYDQDRITVDEFRQIKKKYQLTARGFGEGIEQGDPDALTCLYWTMLRQAGDQAAVLSDSLNFAVGPLYTAMAAAQAAEEASEKARLEAEAAEAARLAAVPTRPAGLPSPEPGSPKAPASPGPADGEGPGSTGSSTATSSSSAASTSSPSPGSATSAPPTSEG